MLHPLTSRTVRRMATIAALIAAFALPACVAMVTPLPSFTQHGCMYDGKFYHTGEVMHQSTNGDCVSTVTCGSGGTPIAGDSQGCFKLKDKRDVADNATNEEKQVTSIPSPVALPDEQGTGAQDDLEPEENVPSANVSDDSDKDIEDKVVREINDFDDDTEENVERDWRDLD